MLIIPGKDVLFQEIELTYRVCENKLNSWIWSEQSNRGKTAEETLTNNAAWI